MTDLQPISRITGTGVVVRGNDIDTDRIIPARYMKVVTFDGIEKYVFQDVRIDPTSGESLNHPFDDSAYADASVLIVNKNFGCGSSREHAPQALARWGVKAIVGESFAEIFFGNCISLGVPCLTLAQERILYLMEAVEANPGLTLDIDIEASEVRVPERQLVESAEMPEGAQHRLLQGTWDALAVLSDARSEIAATASKLPYLNGFA